VAGIEGAGGAFKDGDVVSVDVDVDMDADGAEGRVGILARGGASDHSSE
jgi:hypothetical protein